MKHTKLGLIILAITVTTLAGCGKDDEVAEVAPQETPITASAAEPLNIDSIIGSSNQENTTAETPSNDSDTTTDIKKSDLVTTSTDDAFYIDYLNNFQAPENVKATMSYGGTDLNIYKYNGDDALELVSDHYEAFIITKGEDTYAYMKDGDDKVLKHSDRYENSESEDPSENLRNKMEFIQYVGNTQIDGKSCDYFDVEIEDGINATMYIDSDTKDFVRLQYEKDNMNVSIEKLDSLEIPDYFSDLEAEEISVEDMGNQYMRVMLTFIGSVVSSAAGSEIELESIADQYVLPDKTEEEKLSFISSGSLEIDGTKVYNFATDEKDEDGDNIIYYTIDSDIGDYIDNKYDEDSSYEFTINYGVNDSDNRIITSAE